VAPTQQLSSYKHSQAHASKQNMSNRAKVILTKFLRSINTSLLKGIHAYLTSWSPFILTKRTIRSTSKQLVVSDAYATPSKP